MTDEERIYVAERETQQEDPAPAVPNQCSDETWHEFMHFIDAIVGQPVRYGPGRGLFVDGKFIVTHGPGSLGAKSWNGGKTFPSFHCTSFTNFFLGWLLRRNEMYTHAGNIPELPTLLTASADEHVAPQPGGWTLRYRGYGDACFEIASDGSTKTRGNGYIDARELYDRRDELPTFVVCGQSTFMGGRWKWWHHTVLFAFRGGKMYRIAADGYAANNVWSGDAMKWVEVTEANVGALASCVYRAWGVTTVDGSYGDAARPIAEVTFE